MARCTMREGFSFTCISILLLGAGPPQDDVERIQGTWRVLAARKNGESLPNEVLRTMKVIIRGDTLTIQDGQRDESAPFVLHPATTPRSIDVGSPADGLDLGIYELDGENLKLCWSIGSGERPTAFPTTSGSEDTLLILKREDKP